MQRLTQKRQSTRTAKIMKPRFTIRAALILIAFLALLLMNVRERSRHVEAIAAARSEVEAVQGRLQTHGLSAALEPFEADQVSVVVLDLFGDGQATVRSNSIVARRVLIETAEPADVFTVDEQGRRNKVCATQVRDGPHASCSLTVFAHVPSARPAGAFPNLEFGLYPAGGSASGRSRSSTINKGDQLKDHFRCDLQTGVYERGEAIDFYGLGGNSAGDLRLVKLWIAPPAKPPAGGAPPLQ